LLDTPEINNEILELISLDTKLGQQNSRNYLTSIACFTSDVPLELLDLDQETYTQIAELFILSGMVESGHVEPLLNGFMLDAMPELYKLEFIKPTDSVQSMFIENAFGGAIFNEYDYRIKDDERALNYLAKWEIFPTYEVAEIDHRNQLIEKISNFFDDKMLVKPFTKFAFSSALEDSSSTQYQFPFCISGNVLIAISSYWYL
jgi:hypothetical protein